MPLLYAVYKKKIKPLLEKLSFQQLIFAAVCTADYPDRQYGDYFSLIEHSKQREVLQEAISYLWKTVDNVAKVNFTEQRRHLKKVREIDIDNLDFAVPNQCGILKIMEATESALVFLKSRNINNVIEIGYYPIDVLNSIKDSQIPWYETPPLYDIDDPFFKEELTAQIRIYDYLSFRNVVSRANKKDFRS